MTGCPSWCGGTSNKAQKYVTLAQADGGRGAVAEPVFADVRRIHAVAVGVGKVRDHAHFQQGQQQGRRCVAVARHFVLRVQAAFRFDDHQLGVAVAREEQDAAGIGKDIKLDEAMALAQLVHDGGQGFVLQETIVVQQ